MAELASLQIKVVRDGIEQAQKALNDLSKAADSAEKSAGKVGKSFEDANKKTKTFNSDIMALAKFVGGAVIAKGFYDIGSAALQAAANMEQQKVAFTTMLGSAEKANALLKDMQAFAASTPFSFNEITDAGKRLIAFGFDASTVIDNLRMLGDVSAGLSQPVGDMVYLFGQIKTQGRAMTQDLMQFANRGVPIYDELAKVLGVSTAQVKDFASQGKIGFKEIEQVFKNLTSEGGKFAGLMDAQSKTLAGKWSNFNDTMDQTLVLLGNKLSPAASDLIVILSAGLGEVAGMLNGEIPDSITMTGSIIKDVKNMIDGTADTVERIGASLGDAKVEEILNEVQMWEASSTGVSAKVDELMKKYGDVNAAAGIYSEYVKGHVKLTDDQVKNLEAIIQKHKEMLDHANQLTSAYDRMAAAFIKAGGTPKPEGKKPGVSGGESKYNFTSELKYANDTITGSMSEIDQLTVKYNEQIDRLDVLQNAARKGSDAEMTAWNAKIAATQKFREEMEKLNGSADGFNTVMADIGKQLASASVNAAAEGFEKIGEALGQGEMSGKAFKKIMAEALWQVISAIPMMMVAAGLQMLIASGGTNPVGYAFVAAGMAGQVGVGYVNGKIASEESSAHGNVYGFAQGGTFTNEIVNSPTRFMFSRGGTTGQGLMGEAGTEAVVPLRRMSNGNLGVESSGGGGEVNINIVNASGEKVSTKRKSTQNGEDITVTIGNVVAKGILDGTYDKQLSARYGTKRRGI